MDPIPLLSIADEMNDVCFEMKTDADLGGFNAIPRMPANEWQALVEKSFEIAVEMVSSEETSEC